MANSNTNMKIVLICLQTFVIRKSSNLRVVFIHAEINRLSCDIEFSASDINAIVTINCYGLRFLQKRL